MRKLIKSVFRSLKHNKITVVGLTFLVFISTGMFTVLNSTTVNINKQYKQIARDGNLHDFTVSELYALGAAKFEYNYEDKTHVGVTTGGDEVPFPTQQTISANEYIRTYYYAFDLKNSGEGVYKDFYENHKNDVNYRQYLFPTFSIKSDKELTYLSEPQNQISKSKSECVKELETVDGEKIQSSLKSCVQDLYSIITKSESSLSSFLKSDKMKNAVEFKNHRSIDINNSPDNIYYKNVQSNPEDTINKTTMFDDSAWSQFSISDFNPTSVQGNSSEQIFKILSHKVTTEYNEMSVQKFKLISRGILKDTSNHFKDDYKLDQLIRIKTKDEWDVLKAPIQLFIDECQSSEIFYDKNYRYTIQWNYKGSIPINWTLDNWTSKFTIVNPQYYNEHFHNHFTKNTYLSFVHEDNDKNIHISFPKFQAEHPNLNDRQLFIAWMNSMSQVEFDYWFQSYVSTFKKSVVKPGGDGTPYIILGPGITSDFIYPIVNLQRPVPNPVKECILFSNTAGFQRLYDGYRGNPSEMYIVGKFKNGINKAETLALIREWSKLHMAWPKGIECAYLANDTSNYLNASAFRIAYIPRLIQKVDFVDYCLTIFVLTLSLLICAVVIRRYVSANRVNIGIMRANGITRKQIALSMFPFALIPSVIGGILGYLIGTSLQVAAIGLFSSYWTVPTLVLKFSWVASIVSIIIPFVIFMVTSFFTTIWVLRERTVDLMKPGSENKINFASKTIKKPFQKLGVLGRFRASLAFNSLGKLLILCVMSSLALSSIVFGLTLKDKFTESKIATFKSRDYTYAVDLFTPTTQGGQYHLTDINAFGNSGFGLDSNGIPLHTSNSNETDLVVSTSTPIDQDPSFDQLRLAYPNLISYIWKNYYSPLWTTLPDLDIESFKDPNGRIIGNMFTPFMNDSAGQQGDLQYLMNRRATKNTMDYVVGISMIGLATNPWEISTSVMPENTTNMCIQTANRFINRIGQKYANNPEYKSFFQFDKDTNTYSLDKEACTYRTLIGPLPVCLEPKFIKFLTLAYSESEEYVQDNAYAINYNTVPVESSDETYTYIDASGTADGKNYDGSRIPSEKSKILGIKPDTQFLHLTNSDGQDLLPLLKINDGVLNYQPLIINAYAAKKLGASVGDKIAFKVNNRSDRIQHQIDLDNETDENKKKILEEKYNQSVIFEVVGINTTYENEEYFTNQELANKILGLKSHLDDFYASTDKNYKRSNVNANYIDFDLYDGAINTSIFDPGAIEDHKRLAEVVNLADRKYDTDIDIKFKDGSKGNVTPYGFNGVFTKSQKGGAILYKGTNLYSPSGMWPGTDIYTNSTMTKIIKYGANIQIANKLTGLNIKNITDKYNVYEQLVKDGESEDKRIAAQQEMITDQNISDLIHGIVKYFGNSTLTTTVIGAMDKNSSQIVFDNMAVTIEQIETVVLTIIIAMVGVIVMVMTSLLISDSKRLAAIMKALGYTDRQNATSFLSIYIPVIILGLLLAIPLTWGLVLAFQAAIFEGVGILLTTSIKWWYYLVGLGAIGIVFIISGFSGYASLKKDRLVDMIK